jgi:hypothetical protein
MNEFHKVSTDADPKDRLSSRKVLARKSMEACSVRTSPIKIISNPGLSSSPAARKQSSRPQLFGKKPRGHAAVSQLLLTERESGVG